MDSDQHPTDATGWSEDDRYTGPRPVGLRPMLPYRPVSARRLLFERLIVLALVIGFWLAAWSFVRCVFTN